MHFKKPFVGILLSTFILAACGGDISSLTTEEKSLYSANEEAGRATITLAENLNDDPTKTPNYERIQKIALETSEKLAQHALFLETVSLSEETAQIKENSLVNLDSTIRIVDKIQSISEEAQDLISTDDEALETATIKEINRSLNGFRGRLQKSKEKFDNLNTQLLEESSTHNENS